MRRNYQILVLIILPLIVSACSIGSYIKDANYKELFSLHGDAQYKADKKPLPREELKQLSVTLKENGASCGQDENDTNANIVCYSLYGSNGRTRVKIWDLNLKAQTMRRYGREINEWWNSDELAAAQKSFAIADGRSLI